MNEQSFPKNTQTNEEVKHQPEVSFVGEGELNEINQGDDLATVENKRRGAAILNLVQHDISINEAAAGGNWSQDRLDAVKKAAINSTH